MSYMVSYNQNDMIVIVQVLGSISIEDLYAARTEALWLCQEKNCLRLLVNLRELITELWTTMDCFHFGESFKDKTPRVRIAHVLPVHEKSREDVRFTFAVMGNRGLDVREFECIDKARKWLLQN